MPNPDASTYGRSYWCVGLKDAEATEVYLHADEVRIADSGALILESRGNRSPDGRPDTSKPLEPYVAFAPGEWSFLYAASVMDGHAVSVQSWPGQIV